ncbi:cytochrome P450 [Saccharopolyspora sp. WRP15-2]|uniref:Cytochrome P450 n=1 Tax=Saccharopolyspora oryzae TaxID=2997343 RepID=A0ABT4UWS6_9PSEU|nr:cytochrome P450 [Saccharopolyspora oryzae]MDA3626172.1 cytochrome P450 [Saccharopolyspora oryzae]
MEDRTAVEASNDQRGECPHLRQLSLDPAPEQPLDDPPYFGELRATCPISQVDLGGGTISWLATRFDDVKAILSDTRFSANPMTPGFPVRGLPGSDHPMVADSMIRQDPPLHTTLRRCVVKYFTPRAVEGYRDQVEAIVDDHLNALAEQSGPVDLVSQFALAIPTTVITRMLGIPIEDAPRFFELTERQTTLSLSKEEMYRNVEEFRALGLEYAALKEANPSDDLLSNIIREQYEVGGITRDQLAALITILIIGGHDTTAGMIGLSIFTLLKRPDQLALLLSGERRWDIAIEELLRVHSVARMGPRRAATEDVTIGEHTFRQGEGVVASIWSANHDESKYARTTWEDFEIPTEKPQHLAFSFGQHQCVGQNLARMELMVALPRIFARFPDMQLTDPEVSHLSYRDDRAFFSLKELAVTL